MINDSQGPTDQITGLDFNLNAAMIFGFKSGSFMIWFTLDMILFAPFFICVQMFCLHVCLSAICMPGVHGVKKRTLDPLGL